MCTKYDLIAASAKERCERLLHEVQQEQLLRQLICERSRSWRYSLYWIGAQMIRCGGWLQRHYPAAPLAQRDVYL